ncbi:MAG: hypothetical protein KGP08_08995, partial [Xanthomonadaceae bacterium]|nr:hypothetical protein [Xanthomonadaceae bacterium]
MIYAVLVASVTWQSLPQPSDIPYEKDQLKLLSTRSLEILAGRTPAPSTSPSPQSSPLVFEMPNGHKFEAPAGTPVEQAQEVAQDYMLVLQSQVKERRTGAIKTAFIVWLVPVLGVLAIGW